MADNKIKVRAFYNQLKHRDSVNIDSKKTYEIDFSAWAEEFGTVASVTWTVKSGQATISNQSLSSNVATALLTFSQSGTNLIQIKGTTSSDVCVVYLEILVKDPEDYSYFNDYI